jgi:hypothetical protein
MSDLGLRQGPREADMNLFFTVAGWARCVLSLGEQKSWWRSTSPLALVRCSIIEFVRGYEDAISHARTPSTMLRGPLVGTTRVSFNPAFANNAANSFFVRSRPPMMSI